MITDEQIWEWYMKGFDDELNGTSSIMPDDMLLVNAYTIGAADAIIGDDITSHDSKPKSIIIKEIRTITNG